MGDRAAYRHLADLNAGHFRAHVEVVGAHDARCAGLEDNDPRLSALTMHRLLVVAQVNILPAGNHDARDAQVRGVVEPGDNGGALLGGDREA